MQSPVKQQTVAERDREMTDRLYNVLTHLPEEIGGLEVEGAALTNAARQAKLALEDAELNVTLSAPQDGKNADARKLELAKALASDETVKNLRKEVNRYEAEIEMNEAEQKSKRREFQASVALAELHAARINAMYRINKTN